MSAVLYCDAPGCVRQTPAVIRLASISTPEGWWMQPTPGGVVVACSAAHLNEALKAGKGQQSKTTNPPA